MSFMRRCIGAVKPDAVVHLGDYYDDGTAMAEEFPGLPFTCIPGNCDRYRCPGLIPEVQEQIFGGVRFFMTHGHRHNVKTGIGGLLADARRSKAQVVLYGHTHRADCHRETDGLWVMNPGSCGAYSGSAGVIEICSGEIAGCRLIRHEDLEE